jgi:hypothetical protein
VIDIKNLKESNIILVGGMDRAGTTKVGSVISKQLNAYLIPEIFPLTLCVLNFPEKYSIELNLFLISYRGRDLDEHLKQILLSIKLNLDLNNTERIDKFWCDIQINIGKKIVETSPINLEITSGLDCEHISLVYLNRKIEDIWSSHKKILWGPCTPFDMIRDFERRTTLINSIKDKSNSISFSYNEIPDFEQMLEWKEEGFNLNSLPEFTQKQHENVSKKFEFISYKIPEYEKYVFSKSAFSDLSLKRYNLYQKIFFELTIFCKSLKRLLTIRASSFFRNKIK